MKKEKPKNKTAIIFDLNGVIGKEGHRISKLLTPLLQESDPEIEYPNVKTLYNKLESGKISEKEFWKKLGVNKPKQIKEEFWERAVPESGIKETLTTLQKEGFITAIFSNNVQSWGEEWLRFYNMYNLFDEILFCQTFKVKKPDPKYFELLINRLGKYSIQKYCFIDDRLKHLEAGAKFGFITILVEREKQESRYAPDFSVLNPNEIINIIK